MNCLAKVHDCMCMQMCFQNKSLKQMFEVQHSWSLYIIYVLCTTFISDWYTAQSLWLQLCEVITLNFVDFINMFITCTCGIARHYAYQVLEHFPYCHGRNATVCKFCSHFLKLPKNGKDLFGFLKTSFPRFVT